MAARLIDVSLTLRAAMPYWPGTAPLVLTRTMSLEAGDAANVSRLDLDVHTGTHVDAPSHFLAGAGTAHDLRLEDMIGPAVVGDLRHVDFITAADLDRLELPVGTVRLLLRTRNSNHWGAEVTHFREDFVALVPDAAQWIVDRGIRLVGIDYLSVQQYNGDPRTHQILLAAGIVILEGIDLSAAEPGGYELLCLPLRLADAEGAPARAVLRELTDVSRPPSIP